MKQRGKSFPASRQSAYIVVVLVFSCVTASAQTANVNVVNTPTVRVTNPVLRVGGSVTIGNPSRSRAGRNATT